MNDKTDPHTDNIITNAQLQWDEEGQPVSRVFGDVYFSRANGLEETRHVFLHHNQLAERWQQLKAGEHFTIAETGFGSGLNFLAAWELWLNTAPETAQLHFVTVEKFPLHKTDLIRALALWPELHKFSTELIDAYPVFISAGFHRLSFMNGRIKLTLIINDAAVGFEQLLATSHPLFASECAKVDAWFLDGFAPSKNPQMWSDPLFSAIQLLSHSQTTAATFSAAAIVKNGLKNAGFAVQKVAGFGRKREMVKAQYVAEPTAVNAADFWYRGSYSPYPVPWTINTNQKTNDHKHALVIGGGLAGCSSARALAERGWQVTLIERHTELAQEASGNPQGVLYAKLSHKSEMQAEFNLAALQFAIHHYAKLWPTIGAKTGVLQLGYCETERQLHEQLREKFSAADELVQFVSAAQASELAGVTLNYPAIHFPHAGWIYPRALCEHWVDHPAIRVMTQTAAIALNRTDENWEITTHDRTLSAPVVIIANARDATAFSLTQHLPIKAIRGQTTYLPESPQSQNLKTVICSDGYISPSHNGMHCTGATFTLKDESTAVRHTDHHTNLNNLREFTPTVAAGWETLDLNSLEGRVAFRCSLPDYLPVVGAAPHENAMLNDFAPLRKNSRAGIPKAGSYWPGLFINLGHGSRGLAYTPICAELLAAQINGEILPTPQDMANALNPARFLIRDLIKNKR